MSWNKNHLPYNKKTIDEDETSVGLHNNVNKRNDDEIPDPKSKWETNNNLRRTGNKRKKSGPVAFTHPLKPKHKSKQFDGEKLIHEEVPVYGQIAQPHDEYKVELNMRSAQMGPSQQPAIYEETSPHIFDDENEIYTEKKTEMDENPVIGGGKVSKQIKRKVWRRMHTVSMKKQ